jgi:two-component system sensor histidine kinase CpxA
MGSLFARILLWFTVTITLSIAGFAATAVHLRSKPSEVFDRMHRSHAHEAELAYERGGRSELSSYLARLNACFDCKHYFTDDSGIDVVEDVDRSELLANAEKPRLVFIRSGPHILAGPSPDGKHRLLVVFEPPAQFLTLLPYFLWIFAMAAGLCFLLALDIAAPLRKLRRTVERFGKGDMQARVALRRRDEMGVLAEAFNRMADQISTLLAAERRLLQDVSHEIRSPLARLRIAVELIRPSSNRDGAMTRVRKEVDRLGSLVDEMLQLTRAEGDASARNLDEVDLPSVLEELAEDCSAEAELHGCRIEVQADVPALMVGDRELIRRAVENVLRNAIRFAPEETAVELRLEPRGPNVAVVIRDYGPGVPGDSLESIFHPFYRVEDDRSRSSGGVGLGLAIAQRSVHLHDGVLFARNAHPGLEVTIELPWAASAVPVSAPL